MHDCRCGGLADGLGAASAVDAVIAAGNGDDDAKHGGVTEPDDALIVVDHLRRGREVLHGREIEHGNSHQKAAEYAHGVGKDRKQGHHDGKRQHARQDKIVHRGNAHGLKGVYFLVDLHGADESSVGSADAA